MQMGKMRLKVSLFGDLRKEWSPGSVYKETQEENCCEMQKTRGLQIIQMYYCKACQLPWINSQEGRTSPSEPHLTLSRPPSSGSFLSISSGLHSSGSASHCLACIFPSDLPSLLPTATTSSPFSCFGAGDEIFSPFGQKLTSTLIFPVDALSCRTCEWALVLLREATCSPESCKTD